MYVCDIKTGSWWYCVSCATLLLVTAGLKLHSVFVSTSLIMEQADPVFHISNHFLMLAAAMIEILVGIVILLNFSQRLSLGVIAWMGLVFLGYHVLTWIIGESGCPCLGRVVRISPWLDVHQNVFIWAIILYMLAGPFFLLTNDKNRTK